MNNCKICGQPSGIYEICKKCQKDVENGKIYKCNNCNNYHFAYESCSNQNKNTKKTRKKILITIISIILIFAITIISVFTYQNTYGTDWESGDIVCKYTLYNDKLVIILIPQIDIKELSYYIRFNGSNNSEHKEVYTKDFIKANEEIIHTFYIPSIEIKYLKNEEYKVWGWNIISAKIKNKYQNQERIYPIEYNNECSFVYNLSWITKTDTYYEKSYSYEDFEIYATITNNTNKTILSIQNGSMDVTLQGNMYFDIYFKRIDFDTPLEPGKSVKIKLEDHGIESRDINYKNVSEEIIIDKYDNNIKSIKYENAVYSIVYEGY